MGECCPNIVSLVRGWGMHKCLGLKTCLHRAYIGVGVVGWFGEESFGRLCNAVKREVSRWTSVCSTCQRRRRFYSLSYSTAMAHDSPRVNWPDGLYTVTQLFFLYVSNILCVTSLNNIISEDVFCWEKNCSMLTSAKMKHPLLNKSTQKYHEYTEHLIKFVDEPFLSLQ
jgi:hypothetical protein